MSFFYNPLLGNNNTQAQDFLSFNYKASMDGLPPDLQNKFNQLGEALNAKSAILSKYKNLFPQLELIKESLTGLLKANESINKTLQDDLNGRIKLEDEKNSLQQQLDKAKSDSSNDAGIITDLNDQLKNVNDRIRENDQEIASLKSTIGNNDALISKIEPLLGNIQDYISNNMPITGDDVTQGQQIINEINTLMQNNARGIQSGGYRYSSSQMRRKSTARRSSSSRSSSSQRRRNKKRTAKKMMLGGKRMKKTKSTKRKNHKKH
jgi:predicted  nucleic acid-binding Zn-ribbon protein